ncbi:MAG: proline racemase family protein, partial [bacterium]
MREPRGHKDMFGVLLTEPTTPDADYGALFIDSAGAIDMCGHGLMALTTALIELGLVAAVAPHTTLRFDTPAGRVEARALIAGERVSSVSLTNVPAFVLERDVAIRLAGVGEVRVDVVFGGNFFALVPASA